MRDMHTDTPAREVRARSELQYHHITIAFLATIAVFFLLEPIYKTFLPIYLTYNEGWNAHYAARAMRGLNLYSTANPLSLNNYPPLSFYIVGGLGALLGDQIVAGRIIAVLSFLVTAVNVSVITYRIGRNTPASVFAGVYFVATMAGIYDVYIGIDDPQMLGHAFMTSGLAVLLGREERRRNLLLSAVLIATGGFVKHNLVSLPISVAIFLLACHRRSFVFWIGCFAGVLSLAFAATLAAFGLDFIQIMSSPRRFTAFRLGKKMLSEPLRLQLPLFCWLVYSSFTIRERYTLLLGVYILVSLVTAIIFSGGDGVNINVFFDLVIGLSVVTGLALNRARNVLDRAIPNRSTSLLLMTVLSISVCLGIIIHVPVKAYRLAKILPQLPSIERETAADIRYLETHPGPIFCEALALCYYAGKELEVDSFYARQLFLTGRRDEGLLLDKVRSGYYDAIQLVTWEAERDDERISRSFIQTVLRCYVIDRISANGAFFTPAPGACAPVTPTGGLEAPATPGAPAAPGPAFRRHG